MSIISLRENYESSLLQKKGIIYLPNEDPGVRFKGWLDIMGVRVGTYASQEEVERLTAHLVPTRLSLELLRDMATAYSLRQVLLLEGGPGVGKTYLAQIFCRMIHGEHAPILQLVGSPRISEFEIFGHWAPKGNSEQSMKSAEEVLRILTTHQSCLQLREKFVQDLNQLTFRLVGGEIQWEEYSSQLSGLCDKYSETILGLYEHIIKNFDRSEWEFNQGALLRAYTHNGGRGYPLIVDEFGLIPQNYQQLFLQVVGENGQLSDGITYFGNSGRDFYPTGEDTWICLITNYPENVPGRHEIVDPLGDRLVWKCITRSEGEEVVREISLAAGGRNRNAKNIYTEGESKPQVNLFASEPIPWWEYESLYQIITHAVWEFHVNFIKYYSDRGDYVFVKGSEEIRRQQKVIEDSARNTLRVYCYVDNFQIVDDEGYIDFAATLENAFELYYINRLVSESSRKSVRNIMYQILDGEFSKIMYGGSKSEVLTIRNALRRISRDNDLRGSPQAFDILSSRNVEILVKSLDELESKIPERYVDIIDDIKRSIPGKDLNSPIEEF